MAGIRLVATHSLGGNQEWVLQCEPFLSGMTQWGIVAIAQEANPRVYGQALQGRNTVVVGWPMRLCVGEGEARGTAEGNPQHLLGCRRDRASQDLTVGQPRTGLQDLFGFQPRLLDGWECSGVFSQFWEGLQRNCLATPPIHQRSEAVERKGSVGEVHHLGVDSRSRRGEDSKVLTSRVHPHHPITMSSHAAVAVKELQVKLGGKPILTGVDMDVRPGDLYGLLGRNGAGKTTAMRCLLGYLPYEGGDCSLFGVSSRQVHKVHIPYGVALDPPGMDDTLTLRQNLEVAAIRGGIRGGRSVEDVLTLVGLSHRQHNRGDRLSHGQGRRAAVARALLGDPKLLVLDEPLSGLDPEGVERMLDLFQRLTREEGVTVVLSSHHLREVEHVCNRVGMIEDGITLLEGEVASLLTEAGDGLRIRAQNPDVVRQVLATEQGVEGPPHLQDGDLMVRVVAGFDAAAALVHLVEAGAGVEEYRREHASLIDVFHHALEAHA